MVRLPNRFDYTMTLLLIEEFAASSQQILQPHDNNACTLDIVTVWALPISLAATFGISLDFFSSGY